MKITLLSLFGLALPATADPALSALFSDHAVLQRDKPLPIWGTADPGEKIAVTLGRHQTETSADPDGKWALTLAAQPVSTDPLELTVKGKTAITRSDILLGDVWLCGGQSNMDMALGACDVPDEIASANHPLIRHFRTGMNFAIRPAEEISGSWTVCGPGTAFGFSAVAYYFGREIQTEAGVPIGLLASSVGGTNIELWISQYGKTNLVASGPLFQKISVENDHIRLHFDSVGSGLMTARKEGHEPAVATPDTKLQRFAIAGENRRWIWADAVINGETIVVSSPEVPNPVAVRYAYSSNPTKANLYNRAGLPASPFRTDKW